MIPQSQTLQTNQSGLSFQPSLPHEDDCKARKDTKFCMNTKTKLRTPQTMEATIDNEPTTTPEPQPINRQQPKTRGEGGLNAFYWYQIFALDSAKWFSSHEGFLSYAMFQNRETI